MREYNNRLITVLSYSVLMKPLEEVKSGKVNESQMAHGRWKIRDDRNVELMFNGIEHVAVLRENYTQMILLKPLQFPPTVATLIESDEKIQVADITGNWDWKHDGRHKNGDIIIH